MRYAQYIKKIVKERKKVHWFVYIEQGWFFVGGELAGTRRPRSESFGRSQRYVDDNHEGCFLVRQSSSSHRWWEMKGSKFNETASKSGQTDATSATEDEMLDTVSIGRRQISSLSTIVLSAVVACGVTITIVDWRYAADVCRHLLSTTTELWSAPSDQKVTKTKKQIWRNREVGML